MNEDVDEGWSAVDPTWVGRTFAALSVLVGLVFVSSPVHLLSALPVRPELAAVATIVQALAVAYGCCLVGIGYLGAGGQRPVATIAPVLLAVALLVVGPGFGYPLGVFNWAGLMLASVFAGGLPAMWALYAPK